MACNTEETDTNFVMVYIMTYFAHIKYKRKRHQSLGRFLPSWSWEQVWLLQLLVTYSTDIGCRHTWIQKLWLLCHSTSCSIANIIIRLLSMRPNPVTKCMKNTSCRIQYKA